MQDFDLKPAADLGLTLAQRWRSPKRESGLVQSAGHFLFAFATRTFLRLWNRLEIHGQKNVPREPPFIVVGNHASHLDALVLAAPLPYGIRDRVFPLAAGDIFFQSAVVSALAAGFINAIPLWRKQSTPKALQELRQRLVNEPCVYLLFPEGARTRDGNYLRFKPGVGMLVAGSTVPVVPCHLRGTFEACPAGRFFPLPRKIAITIGQPLRFPDVANNREGWDIIIGQVEKKIRELGERK